MGKEQEKFIREFCDAWGDGTAESRPDVEKIISMMSENAIWQLWIPGGPVIRGREAGVLLEQVAGPGIPIVKLCLVCSGNPGPLGQVRGVRLCLKNVFEIAVAKP